jgi:hypothetical protein
MPNEPKGNLSNPLGFDPTGLLRPFEMTVDGFLRIFLENNIVSITHALLDGSIHPDTSAGSPVRGDIIRGNSTPNWARLPRGTANQIVSSNGTDVLYQTLATLIKNAIMTSDGDILIRTAAGNIIGRAIGSVGDVLSVSTGPDPEWQNPFTSIYNTAAGQIIPNAAFTIINFNTKIEDIYDLVTTGVNWSFKPQQSGVYLITTRITFDSTATWADTEPGTLSCYVNGVSQSILDYKDNLSPALHYLQLNGSYIVRLNALDTVTIRVYQGSGGNLPLLNIAIYNGIEIVRLSA